ncbi:Up in starvation [Sporothrix stenoceras]|uniref:Up in starvation n=1 Tax=Sporothrix stenoceras TaxID=5173 RepID=A0ABR3YQS7_9PEZI
MDATMDDGNGAPQSSLASQMPLPNPPETGSAAATAPTNNANTTTTSTTAHSNGDSASDHSSSQMQRNRSHAGTSVSDEAADAANMSDNDSNADGEGTGKSGRKKKSQRFYCTEFPPCNLSFTRSEHLARHIRKHTGERPFECHCQRRFSRLDNLRQHAQTVHMHEDIPLGSLAASGTRFQRQIRPERTRIGTPGVRARAGSIGGPGGPVPARGHSKSFSTSNIALGSGGYTAREDLPNMRDMRDMRPRPPPIATHDPRNNHPAYRDHPNASYQITADGYRPMTPPEMTTPTSSTFSNGPASPHWSTNRMVSPSPFGGNSRPHSMYATTETTPSRRMSVGEGLHFQSPTGPGPHHPASRHMYSASASSNGGGLFSSPERPLSGRPVSPDNSTIYAWSRRDSLSSTTDERRRTWHPSSRDFGGPMSTRNGVTGAPGPGPTLSVSAGNIAGPYPPPESTLPLTHPPGQQTSNGVRLPGIDSFLNMQTQRPASPIRRGPSPMMVDGDQQQQQRYSHGPQGPPTSILRSPADQHPPQGGRPSSGHWESGLQHGLNRLDIASRTPPQDMAREWAHQQQQQPPPLHSGYPHEDPARRGPPFQQQSVRFEPDVGRDPREDPFAGRDSGYTRGHQHTMSAPAFNAPTSRQQKRQAWYNGPAGGASAGGGTNERVERVGRMVHPNLANGFQGFPARGVPQTVHEHPTHAQDEEAAAYHHEQEQRNDRYHTGPPPPSRGGPQDGRHLPHPSQQGHPPPPGPGQSPSASDSYNRLDALVAVATNQAQTSASAF